MFRYSIFRYIHVCVCVSVRAHARVCVYNFLLNGFVGDCNFEDSSCTWKNVKTDDFDWVMRSGKTPTPNTGPEFDHTIGTNKGKVSFIFFMPKYFLFLVTNRIIDLYYRFLFRIIFVLPSQILKFF